MRARAREDAAAAATAHTRAPLLLYPSRSILAWHYALGVPFNPRTMNATHMAANLAVFDIVLTPT